MAAISSLPPEQAASYTIIIDGILAKNDLNTITPRTILNGLQSAVSYDITPQKSAIKELILSRFNKIHEEREVRAASAVQTVEKDDPSPPVRPVSLTNGHPKPIKASSTDSESYPAKRPAADSDETPSQASPPPAKKKQKKSDGVLSDAALAAKLQAEELARSRPTRGGSSRKTGPVVKKKAKKKSKDRIGSDSDSDVDSSRPEKKVNRNTGFHKLLTLSPALSDLFDGEAQLSRPQATKRLWTYIKANDLQDPADKRTIRCDDRLRAVFKTDRINMFAMTKLMSQNMYVDGE